MNELCQAENTVAQRSNHSEVEPNIVEDAQNAESAARPNLGTPGDDQAVQPGTMQEEDRQNCGVLSNGGRKFDQDVVDARRRNSQNANSDNHDDDANIAGSKLDLDQKKLLCGSKRLFN